MQQSGTEIVSGEQVRSRATGALFFLGFGSFWVFTGLVQTHQSSRTGFTLLGLVSGLLLVLTIRLMRRARNLPSAGEDPELRARARRMFNAVNIIQWVSIGTALVILNLLRLPAYIVPAIAIIVGLHLFPLAAAFRYRAHYATGTLLLLWPAGCLAMLPRDQVSGVCALGVGAILLGSAALTLLRSFAGARSVLPMAVATHG